MTEEIENIHQEQKQSFFEKGETSKKKSKIKDLSSKGDGRSDALVDSQADNVAKETNKSVPTGERCVFSTVIQFKDLSTVARGCVRNLPAWCMPGRAECVPVTEIHVCLHIMT